jgi:hypothetical protein
MDITESARVSGRLAEMMETSESIQARLLDADEAAAAGHEEKLWTMVWFLGQDVTRLNEDLVELGKLAPPAVK